MVWWAQYNFKIWLVHSDTWKCAIWGHITYTIYKKKHDKINMGLQLEQYVRSINNNIGLLHEYWWILSRALYHIAQTCECNMIYCEGQYSCDNPFII
jgi:hypothetical protein